jgi:hypothetical protein
MREQIHQSLVAAKSSHDWSKDGGKYIPNPATWLNQGRWDDEITESKTTSFAGFTVGKG